MLRAWPPLRSSRPEGTSSRRNQKKPISCRFTLKKLRRSLKHHSAVRAFDVPNRTIVLYDRSHWVVATYDVPHCRDWQWDGEEVDVYDDDHQPGWYLLFNGWGATCMWRSPGSADPR
jgi:hypothetical protein